MSNIIEFLEKLGQSAPLSDQSEAEFSASIEALELDDAARDALMARNSEALNELLGGRMQMMCLLFPAEGEENKDDDPDDSDQPDDGEKKESVSRISRH